MTDELNVHDTAVSTVPTFTPTGVKNKTRVVFYVGKHGPFTLELDPAEATGTNIRQAIDKQVQTLREVTAIEGT